MRRDMAGLTQRRKDVLDALGRFCERHGRPPNLRELGFVVGLSRTTVYQHLQALRRLGLIEHRHGVGAYLPRESTDERSRSALVAAEIFIRCAAIARRHRDPGAAAVEMEEHAKLLTDAMRAQTQDPLILARRFRNGKRAEIVPLTFGRARLLLSAANDDVSTLDEW